MRIPASTQRLLMAVWPVTLLIMLPVIAIEVANLWRKNRVELSKS
jgi:hypothetical protein